MFWKKLHLGRDFSVISITEKWVRGLNFHRKSKVWHLTQFYSEAVTSDGVESACRKVWKNLGKSEFTAVTGKINGAAFFRFQSSRMESSSQMGAVEFELPRQLLKVPEKRVIQFCESGKISGDPNGIWINAAVFPRREVNLFTGILQKAGVQADEFIHPMLAIDEDCDTLYLPEIDPDFGYAGESWMPFPSGEELDRNMGMWREKFRKCFIMPSEADFSVDDYTLALLAAKLIVSGKLHNSPESFRVFPDTIRPVRFRGHLAVTVILSVLLLAALGWRFMLTYGVDIREYRKVTSEISRLKKKNAEMKRSIKRNSKELKEMTRLVAMSIGEADAVAEFALLSETLPNDVLVSSIRWNETDIDVVMLCENSQLDLPALIQPLKYWKVGSLQQRQTGDSAVATINLKLVPFDARGVK